MKTLSYTPPQIKVICVAVSCQIQYDSNNRNRVPVDYDDEEIGLS